MVVSITTAHLSHASIDASPFVAGLFKPGLGLDPSRHDSTAAKDCKVSEKTGFSRETQSQEKLKITDNEATRGVYCRSGNYQNTVRRNHVGCVL